jgi:hypothetical protein
LLFLFIGSLLLSIYLLPINKEAAFYMLPPRLWEFLAGGFLALKRWTPKTQAAKQILAGIGAALIIGAAFLYNDVLDLPFPGQYALPPVLGAALFMMGGDGLKTGSLWLKVFFNPFTRFVGLISYSLYLWHWPFFVLYKNFNHIARFSLGDLAFCLSAVFLVSYFSYRYIEAPFRANFARRKTIVQAAAFLSSISAVLLVGQWLHYANPSFTLFPQQKSYLTFGPTAGKNIESGDVIGSADAPASFLLLGDSHAGMVREKLSVLAKERKLAGRYINHPRPFLNLTHLKDKRKGPFLSYAGPLMGDDRYDLVYIWLRWPKKFSPGENARTMPTGGFFRYYRDGQEYVGAEAYRRGIADTMEYFRQKGAKNIYLLLPVPESEVYIPQNAAWMILSHPESYINQTLGVSGQSYLDKNKEILDILRDIEATYPFVKLLDPRPFLANAHKDGFLAVENGRSLYTDDNHLSNFGVEKVSPLFVSTMDGLSLP